MTREQVEAAIVLHDREPGSRLLSKLPLTSEQIRELEGADGETTHAPANSAGHALPPEVAEALKDPKRRVGRFVLVSLLGKGGMGMVFRGWEPELRQWVALKFLRQIGDDTARAYFKREAQLAAGLDHPNIAKIYEIGEHEGQPFIAMQLVDGAPLSGKDLKLEEKIRIVRAIAEAVRYAHERKVIHRDLKPANVMIDKHGQVYVMDFGLAKETAVEGESLGGSSMVVGTPSYMAPEQAKGKADARSDVYGIGAIFYELVTGRPPFVGETSTDVIMQVITQEPVWPRRLSPMTPEDIEAVILHALEKDRSRRYAEASLLIDDLDALAQKNPLKHARRPTLLYVLGRRIRKQPILWGAVAAMILAILGGGTFGIWQLKRRLLKEIEAREAEARAVQVKDTAARREAGLQSLASFWLTIVERKDEMRSGRRARADARGELERALESVRAHVGQWPDQPQGYYVLARAELYLGNLEQSEIEIGKALQIERLFRPGWALLGMVKVSQYRIALITSTDYVSGQLEERRQRRARNLLDEALQALGRGWESGRESEEAARWGLSWSREDRVAARIAEAFKAEYVDRQPAKSVEILKRAWSEYQAEELASELGMLSSNPDEAIGWQTQAIAVARGYEWAYLRRGDSKGDKGDREGALADYDEAIRLKEDFAAAYTNRGSARAKKGDLAGSLADRNQVLRIRGEDAEAYYGRAHVRKQMGDLKGAIADYDRAITLLPDFAFAYHNRGSIKHLLNDLDGALADYNKAIELKSDDPLGYDARGNTKRDKGDLDGARADYDHAIALKPDYASAYVNRGRLRLLRGELDGAIGDLNRAVGLDKTSAYALLVRGEAKAKRGDLVGALEDLSRAIELKKDYMEAYLNRANVRALKLDLDGALADLDRAIEIDPKLAEAFNNRGLVRYNKRDYEGAIRDLDRALELKPGQAGAHFGRGDARRERGDWRGAIEDYSAAIQADPKRWEAYLSRARARLKIKDPKGALADFNRVIELKQDDPEAYYERSELRRAAGDAEGELADLDRTLELSKDHDQALFARGTARRKRADWDGAIADYTRLIELSPKVASGYYGRGVSRRNKGDLKGALADFDRALELEKDWVAVLVLRGMLKRSLGDLDGAIADLEKALSVAPKDWDRRSETESMVEQFRLEKKK